MNKTKVITRTILILSFISLFTDIASEMLYPVMPVYLKSIGFSALLIGVLEGLAEAVAGISKGYFGNLSDITGRRAIFIKIGYSLSAIVKPTFAIIVHPVWIFFARTFDRIGKGIRTSARDALLSDETVPENKGKVFGFHRSMDTLGASIGPFLALVFLYFFPGDYKTIFLLSIIPGLIAIGLSMLIKDKKERVGRPTAQINFFSFLNYWKTASLSYRQLVIGLLAFTLFNSSDVFLLLFLKHQGLTDIQMIGFYIFYNLVYAAFSYPMGKMADKIGLVKILIFGLVLFVIVYSSISLISSFVLFGVVFFIYGIFASATEGISKALITNLCKKEETATAIGFYTSFSSIFALIASSLAGMLWFWHSPQLMFIFSGIGVTCVIFYLLYIFRNIKYHQQSKLL